MGKKKKDIDWLTNTSLSPAFKTLSRLLFCTQNTYISSLACTAQKTLFSSISVLIYAVCNGNRKRYRSQIHLFKFILSTDRELLTYYILNIVKIIPVTCYMSLQLFLLEKWSNRSTYFLKKLHMEMKKKKRIYWYNVNSEKLQYPFWRTLSSPITCNTQSIHHNPVSLNLIGNSFATTSRKVHR